MVNKILTFIIGVLVGAIITTGVFCIIQKNSSNSLPQNMQNMPSMPGQNGNMGTPPEKPADDQSTTNNMNQPSADFQNNTNTNTNANS